MQLTSVLVDYFFEDTSMSFIKLYVVLIYQQVLYKESSVKQTCLNILVFTEFILVPSLTFKGEYILNMSVNHIPNFVSGVIQRVEYFISLFLIIYALKC